MDPKILTQDGAVRFVPAATPRPGAFTVRFRAGRPGQTWLKLIYRRPFEPAKPPADTFTVHVMVN